MLSAVGPRQPANCSSRAKIWIDKLVRLPQTVTEHKGKLRKVRVFPSNPLSTRIHGAGRQNARLLLDLLQHLG